MSSAQPCASSRTSIGARGPDTGEAAMSALADRHARQFVEQPAHGGEEPVLAFRGVVDDDREMGHRLIPVRHAARQADFNASAALAANRQPREASQVSCIERFLW